MVVLLGDVFYSADDVPSELLSQTSAAALCCGFGEGSFEVLWAALSVVLVNRRDRVVARVDVPGRYELPVEELIVLAVAVANVGAPVIGPLSGEAHKLSSDRWVTFWPLAEPASMVSSAEAGALLAHMHSCTIPPQTPLGVPPLHVHRRDPEVWHHSADPGISQHAMSMMSERWARAVTAARAHQSQQRPAVLCHGDFHVGNMVRLDGRLLLCDLDSVCAAPRECDLADVWVYSRRFWPAGSWDEFVEVYGDSFDAVWVRLLGLERELVHLRYAAGLSGCRPEARDEFEVRFGSLDDPSVRWNDTI